MLMVFKGFSTQCLHTGEFVIPMSNGNACESVHEDVLYYDKDARIVTEDSLRTSLPETIVSFDMWQTLVSISNCPLVFGIGIEEDGYQECVITFRKGIHTMCVDVNNGKVKNFVSYALERMNQQIFFLGTLRDFNFDNMEKVADMETR